MSEGVRSNGPLNLGAELPSGIRLDLSDLGQDELSLILNLL